MSTHLKILSSKEMKEFDSPPEFTGEERKKFFSISLWISNRVKSFRSPTNQVGFILQLGYFKASNKFFRPSRYRRKDIEGITRKLGFSSDDIHLTDYTDTTFKRHQEIILEKFGFRSFDDTSKDLLYQEAISLCNKQMKPKLILLSLIDFLVIRKVEIPVYYTLCEIITAAIRQFENTLIHQLDSHLSKENKILLDKLLEHKNDLLEEKNGRLKKYKLTLLKKSNQSTKPSKIKENVNDLLILQSLYEEVRKIVDNTGLSPELIQYYAQIVIKSDVYNINRRTSKKHLLLIAFIAYQYYKLNDVLTEVLIQSVQNTRNTSTREHKENFYLQRKQKSQKMKEISKKITNHFETIQNVKTIVHDDQLSSDEKVCDLQKLLEDVFDQKYTELKKEFALMSKENSNLLNDKDLQAIWEKKSIKLQNRVSEIVKHLKFDERTSNKTLIETIQYYKTRDGNLSQNAPCQFLEQEEKKLVFELNGKLKVSLYKVFLFFKIADGVRSGALNLEYSYKYRSFDDYLIPREIWKEKKDELLEKAGLSGMKDFSRLESQLNQVLKEQFRVTNENFLQGKNPYLSQREDQSLLLQTPKQEKGFTTQTPSDLFPKNRFISLLEVLSTVNQGTGFIDCFQHWKNKYQKGRPSDKTFFAGIIGNGCNLGIPKISKISRNMNQSELENTVNWYFSNENVLQANDKILEFLEQLPLPTIFKKDRRITHTSSDGQKFNIAVDSLNANYSFKYFGKAKGVSVYSFIDDSDRLFYSTVINPADRDAPHVIDGLMHNDVVRSDIHSTDTHGYSEIIFGVTHLLGISFAPRIKNWNEQQLYSFDPPSVLKELGYAILPSETIKSKIIEEKWDDILRLVATIKLKHTTASQLFKRLSSYSKQHPIYRALKQFGRIIKTLFLLKYMDDVELRQMIEKQLNKIESSNKFAKAVYYGNNQEFQQANKEEQLIVEGCKRLIENSIICWNYLYLSQMLYETKSEKEKKDLLNTIQSGSVVHWQHINLQGEYDFSDDFLRDKIEFRFPELLKATLG